MTSRLLFFSFLFFFKLIYGQSTKVEDRDHYIWFDRFIGIENTGLYNGLQYIEKYKIYKEHQFFGSSDYQKGYVTYHSEKYFDLKIKYNVYEDKVLLKLSDKFGGTTLQLNSDHVDNFNIGKHTFINLNLNDFSTVSSGFYEILLENDSFCFYKKHRKIKKELLTDDGILYNFLDRKSYILFHDNIYHSINSKGDLNKIFPELKKEINKFYNTNAAIRKSNSDTFWILLLKKINSQVANKITM